MHHPLNSYHLVRHLAVGWPIVEAVVEAEKAKKGGNLGKRLARILQRREVTYVPGEDDLAGVARGITRYRY